jgi:hypothetical protein
MRLRGRAALGAKRGACGGELPRARREAPAGGVSGLTEATPELDTDLAVREAMNDRLDALASSPDRQPTREADRAALATLEARGLGAAEREHLRGLVQRAESTSAVDPADAAGDEAAQKKYLADLSALRG